MAKTKLAIWERECSFPDLHQQINKFKIDTNNKHIAIAE